MRAQTLVALVHGVQGAPDTLGCVCDLTSPRISVENI